MSKCPPFSQEIKQVKNEDQKLLAETKDSQQSNIQTDLNSKQVDSTLRIEPSAKVRSSSLPQSKREMSGKTQTVLDNLPREDPAFSYRTERNVVIHGADEYHASQTRAHQMKRLLWCFYVIIIWGDVTGFYPWKQRGILTSLFGLHWLHVDIRPRVPLIVCTSKLADLRSKSVGDFIFVSLRCLFPWRINPTLTVEPRLLKKLSAKDTVLVL